MNKIPTAEEFLSPEYQLLKYGCLPTDTQALKEFTKLHVEAALKAASENAKTKRSDLMFDAKHYVDKESILNAYPVTNIK